MSRNPGNLRFNASVVRFIILAAAILVGVFILEWARRFPSLQATRGLWLLFVFFVALLVSGLGVLLEMRLARKAEQPGDTAAAPGAANYTRLEEPAGLQEHESHDEDSLSALAGGPDTELFQINQELLSRAQEQAQELARLNVELQLEMAMHKLSKAEAYASEERFRNMADNVQEGLTILENDRLVYVNERACEIFGDCPDGDIYSRIFTFAAEGEKQRLSQAIQEAKRKGSFPQKLEYWIVRKDGSQRCIRERYSSSSANGIERTFIVTSDITERVQAVQVLENAVSDRTRELSTVLEVSHRIASTLELEPLLHLILDQIQTIIPYSGAAIFTLEGDRLVATAYQVPGLPPLGGMDHPLYLTLNKAEPYQQGLLEKRVLIIDDVAGDPPLALAIRESMAEDKIEENTDSSQQTFSFEHARSWIGIPLVVRDQVTGLLSLAHSEPSYYTQRHARLAMTIANQVAVAIENARLYEQAQSLAVLEERHRIARELHDSVTQLLYGICLYCTATSRSIRNGNYAQVTENLEEIKEEALQALQEMRLLILELNPPLLQKMGLIPALQASLEMIENRTGLVTELKTEGVKRLPRAIETELYRIAMEALANLVRYARAKNVTVTMLAGEGQVSMEIYDNGVGFDLAKARNSGGMGLHNMEQRAGQIGASFDITSSPGEGTLIRVEAPVEEGLAEPALE